MYVKILTPTIFLFPVLDPQLAWIIETQKNSKHVFLFKNNQKVPMGELQPHFGGFFGWRKTDRGSRDV